MARVLVLLVFSTAIFGSTTFAKDICKICACTKRLELSVLQIECTQPNLTQFDDIDWPNDDLKLRITFRNLGTTILSKFKCNKKIEELNFDDNQIVSFDRKAFQNVEYMEKISFANNSIDKLPEDLFTGLSWLEELNLSSNQLETIPDDVFENLPKLTRIDLSRNLIKVLSDDLISALSQIKSVSLRANNLFNLDHTSLTNISIEFLDLAQNNLVFLKTNQFKSFDKLKTLDLSHNKIKDIQDNAFSDLESLEHLSLANNELVTIDLILPVTLERLELQNNRIERWPIKHIDGKLKRLELQNNSIISVRTEHHYKSSIEHLNLADNKLDQFPAKSFPAIRHLDLSYNMFYNIPAGLGKKESFLEDLIMDGNPMEQIAFPNPIQVLFLSFNNMPKIRYLEDNSFAQVSGRDQACVRLNITKCPLLSEISETAFGNLKFCSLDLSNNRIRTLPLNVTDWSAIKGEINLQGNPIECSCEMEWILTDVLVKLYEKREHQYLLEDLRCKDPDEFRGFRLVKFYQHKSPFCDRSQSSKYVVETRQVDTASVTPKGQPSAGLVIGICGFIMCALMVAGFIMVREEKQRLRRNRERMLFQRDEDGY